MKKVKVQCPYCKTKHVLKEEGEFVMELPSGRIRMEVNCDCGKRFFVDYNRKSLKNK